MSRIEPSLALQKAIFKILQAGDVPVFDRVPVAQAPPYIVLGEDQVLPDKAECFHSSVEVHCTIHVYSYGGGGRAGAKAIAGPVVAALDDVELDVGEEWVSLVMLHDGTRYVDEPDGKTFHGILSFHALLDAA